ncbi:hypothetical protein ACN262_31500 [Burkholderia gladioli]|uniref:hypothetical protein n=1 Tax=Burkholderia gladioli TaxID=28095 RepID=UPI00163F1DED|nr:hypothetical protein [Burkholderia gladioli]
MALPYSIPEQAYEGMRLLSALSADQFVSLTEAVSQFKPAIYHARTLQKLIDDSTGVGTEQADTIRDLLSGLALVRAQIGSEEDKFWADYFAELNRTSGDEGLSEDDIERLATRLPEVLRNDAIGLSALSARVVSEAPMQFTKSFAAVDLRPVFFEDSAEPKGFILVSSFKIESFDGDNSNSVTYSLDEIDLDEILSELEGLKVRIAALKKVAQKANLPLIPINPRRREE